MIPTVPTALLQRKSIRAAPSSICSRGNGPLLSRCSSVAFQVLHNQEVNAIRLSDVVESTTVRMGQLRKRSRFAFQPLPQ
jgi:hypothetical protein